ncbi:hypothetical protein C2E23DRAFT_11072 [Lenzites betulinus]|nr:hypothetical protein C2E23DRAFT_11072 [Lenzites betulinus]
MIFRSSPHEGLLIELFSCRIISLRRFQQISLHWAAIDPVDPIFGCVIAISGIPESVNKTCRRLLSSSLYRIVITLHHLCSRGRCPSP